MCLGNSDWHQVIPLQECVWSPNRNFFRTLIICFKLQKSISEFFKKCKLIRYECCYMHTGCLLIQFVNGFANLKKYFLQESFLIDLLSYQLLDHYVILALNKYTYRLISYSSYIPDKWVNWLSNLKVLIPRKFLDSLTYV